MSKSADSERAGSGQTDSVQAESPERRVERELIEACLAGDEAAWERFYERTRGLVLRAAEQGARRWGVRDPAGFAQDAAAEVFAHLLADESRVLRAFQGRSSLATWLAVIARRRAYRLLRRTRPEQLEEPASLRGSGPSPSEVVQASERAERVRKDLSRLAPRDRLALQLFYEGGHSYQEVAEALAIDERRVGTLLARARKRLAKVLGRG